MGGGRSPPQQELHSPTGGGVMSCQWGGGGGGEGGPLIATVTEATNEQPLFTLHPLVAHGHLYINACMYGGINLSRRLRILLRAKAFFLAHASFFTMSYTTTTSCWPPFAGAFAPPLPFRSSLFFKHAPLDGLLGGRPPRPSQTPCFSQK